MGKINKLITDIEEGKYTAREIVLSSIVLFLAGILLGIIFSPKKRQVIGSFNGNNELSDLYDDDDDLCDIDD